jgi:hypothetical protein
MIYDNDPNTRFGYDSRRLAADDSPVGGLIVLLAIFALLFLGIYVFSPQSDGTRTAQNAPPVPVPTAPAPSPGPVR